MADGYETKGDNKMAKKGDKVKLSPPWDGHMSMLASFFKGDGRVRVGGGTDKGVGTIEVFDAKMYAALARVLRKNLRFGNVRLAIRLVPADGVNRAKGEMTDIAALKVVLSKNPAFHKIVSRKTQVGNFVYVMFKPVVLMWYNDNFGSPYKQTASVYEIAAQKVFRDELGVSYATEPDRKAK